VTTFYFCWEKGASGRWGPVCYHGAPPRSDGDRPTRSTVHGVPDDLIGKDGQPMFGALVERYPAPAPDEAGGL
jgi:hypothetical protein